MDQWFFSISHLNLDQGLYQNQLKKINFANKIMVNTHTAMLISGGGSKSRLALNKLIIDIKER